jgi:chemotaxis protein MotB
MSEECPKLKCPAGIPAWVLTFADLMSLLMCFFVLLLSFSEMDVQKFKQIAGSVKMAFGVQRDIKVVEIPKGVNIVAKEFSPAPPKPTEINEVRQKTSDDTNQELLLVKRIEDLDAQESDLSQKLGKAESQEEAEEIQNEIKKIEEEIIILKEELEQIKNSIDQLQAEEIEKQANQLAEALSEEIEQGVLEIETKPDSFIIRLKDKGAFPAGTARLTDDFIDVLEVIKEELAKIRGAIIVAGHTDNIPINTRAFRSNWDLSAERSVSVVQELLYNSNISPTRISIQAFADSHPLVDNDSPENRSKNRRVEIVVSKSLSELDGLDEEGNPKENENKDDLNNDSNLIIDDKNIQDKGKSNPDAKSTKANVKVKDTINETRRPKPNVIKENNEAELNDIFIPDEANQNEPNFINF